MDRAARAEAKARLEGEVLEYRLPRALQAYLDESSLSPVLGEPRTFLLYGAKEVPPLPSGKNDLLVVVAPPGKTKLEDPRATRVHVFPRFKSFANKNDYIPWILKEGERLNIDLSRVAHGLFVNSRRSLRKVSSEIEKIAALSGPGEVAPELARSVMCFSAELTPKDVLDAICEGKTVKAVVLLDRIQRDAEETGWILAYLQRHVLRQLTMERLLDEGASSGRAASVLGVHPFVYRMMQEKLTGLWSRESLMESYGALCDLDLRHKTGDKSARLGLEIEIVRMSEEASQNVRCS